VSDGPLLYRQGDVLLRRVATLPDGCSPLPREDGRIILAHGEVTGHAHAIEAPADEATLLSAADNARFLQLVRDVEVVHEEHAPIPLPAGLYEVIRQREWTDAAADAAAAASHVARHATMSDEDWYYVAD
jgi:hypothetical protein